MKTRKLWIGFIAVMVFSFAVLLYFGREIYREAPPVPDKVIGPGGEIIFTGEDIRDGQNVWQTLGGQQLGTIWGHGAYQARSSQCPLLMKPGSNNLKRPQTISNNSNDVNITLSSHNPECDSA